MKKPRHERPKINTVMAKKGQTSKVERIILLIFQMKSFFFILLAHAFCLGLASHLPYGEDFMGDYMFGYGVYANEYDQKQNFGQKEHRNEDEVMGEW